LHNGQHKPNLSRREEGLSGLEGLLAVVGLEVTTEGIRTGTGMERQRKRVPNFRGCNNRRVERVFTVSSTSQINNV